MIEARSGELAIIICISDKREWNKFFFKNAPKIYIYTQLKLAKIKIKTTQNITRTLTIFLEHGIISSY